MSERFSTRTGMMFAMLGMAVGTGNIWRFPRIVAKNGGGEFLVAWIVFLFLWSIPIILLEFGMGRKTRSGNDGAEMGLDGRLLCPCDDSYYLLLLRSRRVDSTICVCSHSSGNSWR